MAIIRKVVLSAIFAGILSGIFLSLIQNLQVNSIILQAEQYEIRSDVSSHEHAVAQHHHDTAAWQPSNGSERTFYTYVSNIFAATGFALLLISFMSMKEQSITWFKGAAWGLAGFVTFFLAPSIGLPPEIPGTVSAALLDRQLWWLLAVIGTGGGIAVLVFAPAMYKILGLLLVVVPQIVGAPTTELLAFVNNNPQAVTELQDLSEKFYPATTLTNAVYWLFMGIVSSLMVKWFVFPKANHSIISS
jgi:cobalt transporter subunit CbtA